MANWLKKYGVEALSRGDRQGGVTALFRHASMMSIYHREEARRQENKARALREGTFSEASDRGHAHRNWRIWVRACHIVDMDPGSFSDNDNQPFQAAI